MCFTELIRELFSLLKTKQNKTTRGGMLCVGYHSATSPERGSLHIFVIWCSKTTTQAILRLVGFLGSDLDSKVRVCLPPGCAGGVEGQQHGNPRTESLKGEFSQWELGVQSP